MKTEGWNLTSRFTIILRTLVQLGDQDKNTAVKALEQISTRWTHSSDRKKSILNQKLKFTTLLHEQ